MCINKGSCIPYSQLIFCKISPQAQCEYLSIDTMTNWLLRKCTSPLTIFAEDLALIVLGMLAKCSVRQRMLGCNNTLWVPVSI